MKAALAALVVALCACTGQAADPHSFPVTSIQVGETALSVWVADDATERYQGLREVAELPAGIDGMLFVYEAPTPATFGMLDTLIPLDIWWFDGNGLLVGSGEMEPCPEEPCASYRSPGPVMWVLETPSGTHDFAAGAPLSTGESG